MFRRFGIVNQCYRKKQTKNYSVDFPEHIQCKPLICRFLHAQSGECRTALVLENSTYNTKYLDGHFSCTASYTFSRATWTTVSILSSSVRHAWFTECNSSVNGYSSLWTFLSACVCLHSVCTRLFTISYFNEHRVHIHFRVDDTEELRPRHSHFINTIWLACWLQKREYRHCPFKWNTYGSTAKAHTHSTALNSSIQQQQKMNKIINWKRRNTVDCNLIINNKNRM